MALLKLVIGGGMYKSRRLVFQANETVRPSLARVRETFFNWLGQDLSGMVCLDLFAGSGSLGFEALSRYAKFVYMVDQQASCIKQLQHNLQLLGNANCQIIKQEARQFLAHCNLKFDIVFLDAPYHEELLLQQILLQLPQHLTAQARICIEYRTKQLNIPATYSVQKHATAGVVRFGVVSYLL
jgi:16S rRNA (guanine966-N2)-methyltransferase